MSTRNVLLVAASGLALVAAAALSLAAALAAESPSLGRAATAEDIARYVKVSEPRD